MAGLRALAALFLLAACAGTAAAGIYDELNRLRAGHGLCAAAGTPDPLTPQAPLEQAARTLAGGKKLEDSLKQAGYRSTRASVISVRGDGVGEQAAAMLAQSGYCLHLQDPGLSEIGIYRDADQIWVVMAAPFAQRVAFSETDAGQRVLELINQARTEPRSCGNKAFQAAPPLRWNETLALASRAHAEDMARYSYFSHDGRDGSTPAERVMRAGYRFRAIGENIAAGQRSPEDAVAGWIKSPPHCANLMNPVYAEMGVAFAVDAKSRMGVYWAQDFGTPR